MIVTDVPPRVEPDDGARLVSVGAGGLMSNVAVAVAVRPERSVARIVKMNVPAVEGVPVTHPELVSVVPGGTEPDARVQMYDGRPSDA